MVLQVRPEHELEKDDLDQECRVGDERRSGIGSTLGPHAGDDLPLSLIASNASGTTRSADGILTTASAAPVAVAGTTKNPRSPTAEPEDAGWSSLKSSTFWTNALFNWHFWAFVVAAIVGVLFAFFVGSYFSRPLTPPRKILFGTTPPATTPPTTGSFGWFVVALTVAIAVFLAAMAVAQTWRTPKLQSFALLRKGEDEGLRGFYVAETSNFVHVALVQTCVGWPRNVRIMVVPRSEVVALAIGEKQKLCDAWASSGKHLADLIAKRPDRTVGLPLDAKPKADGSISVPVGRVTYPDRLKIEDAGPLLSQRDGPVGGFPAGVDPACQTTDVPIREQDPPTAGTVKLAIRITTENTEKKRRIFVVSNASVLVRPLPFGLFVVRTFDGKNPPREDKKMKTSDRVIRTNHRGLACLTLEPVTQSSSTNPTRLVLFVRARDPKRKSEVSVRRLMQVRVRADQAQLVAVPD